ncbi:MAG: (Fe-S)-binding protein [Desulfuromonas sp.]|nr:(Fe-S)-binding protein [Desulfuromonas sp.]
MNDQKLKDQTPWGNFTTADAPSYDSLLQCMRCGFCLPSCPTFQLTGRERSSPRGRVAMARAIAEQKLELTPAMKEEAFFCLDCRACTSACPSGVQAGSIMEHCRSQVQEVAPAPTPVRSLRAFVLEKMLPSPEGLKYSMLPTRLYQRLGVQWLVRRSKLLNLGPKWLEKAEQMLPELEAPLSDQLPLATPARGEKRGTVGFFLGCVMNLMYAEVSRQTVRVLAHQGFDVITPPGQKCCGAPHLSEGDPVTARKLAAANLELFMAQDVDYIVTDCAGCGAALKDYEEMLAEQYDEQVLHAFRAKLRDISEFLAEQGLHTDDLIAQQVSVTYHESCHLAHAQQVTAAPRTLINAIPGVELREMKESDWCCGSAATFSLKYVDESRQILERKLDHVAETEADILVTANPGCQLQLAWGLQQTGMPQQMLHIMQLLGRATPD